ncbi:MAG: hypothetical protein AB1489_23265, partial [Acidobacteriota bacterium]
MSNNNMLIEVTRRNMLRMLSLTGAAGILTLAQGSISPGISAMLEDRQLIKSIKTARIPLVLQVPVEANAVFYQLGPSKVEVRFPADGVGYMMAGRNRFRDQADLIAYLSQLFPMRQEKGGYRGTIKRVGKYRRVDAEKRPIFTFGDPMLDLITDANGMVNIAGKTYDMKAAELADPEQRGGGILDEDGAASYERVDSLFKKSSFTTEPASATQSNCPASHCFPTGCPSSPKMKFRAWRKNYVAYWSEGSEIET